MNKKVKEFIEKHKNSDWMTKYEFGNRIFSYMKEEALDAYCSSQCIRAKACFCNRNHEQTCDGFMEFYDILTT